MTLCSQTLKAENFGVFEKLLTEAFTLHGHDCGHVHPAKI